MRRVASRPFIPGISTSISTTWGRSRSASSTACAPFGGLRRPAVDVVLHLEDDPEPGTGPAGDRPQRAPECSRGASRPSSTRTANGPARGTRHRCGGRVPGSRAPPTRSRDPDQPHPRCHPCRRRPARRRRRPVPSSPGPDTGPGCQPVPACACLRVLVTPTPGLSDRPLGRWSRGSGAGSPYVAEMGPRGPIPGPVPRSPRSPVDPGRRWALPTAIPGSPLRAQRAQDADASRHRGPCAVLARGQRGDRLRRVLRRALPGGPRRTAPPGAPSPILRARPRRAAHARFARAPRQRRSVPPLPAPARRVVARPSATSACSERARSASPTVQQIANSTGRKMNSPAERDGLL